MFWSSYNLIISDFWRSALKTITATELARSLSEILDRLTVEREEIVIERNHRQIARLIPGPGRLTALEALADLYRTLPEDAGATWEADSRALGLRGERLPKGVRDPWAS
jgi:antitoxin (DNA-binding transcriptional repressor) of toxin-antitoxin stability system